VAVAARDDDRGGRLDALRDGHLWVQRKGRGA
jgi:hypothetical protein